MIGLHDTGKRNGKAEEEKNLKHGFERKVDLIYCKGHLGGNSKSQEEMFTFPFRFRAEPNQ